MKWTVCVYWYAFEVDVQHNHGADGQGQAPADIGPCRQKPLNERHQLSKDRVDCLRRSCGRFPGKDTPQIFNSAPGKSLELMVFEVRHGISTPERPGPMTGGGGPIAAGPG